METPILKQIKRFLREQKKHKRRMVVFVCLAVVVGFGTVTALKLMGQALTHKEKVLHCIQEVHVHTENCYDAGHNLICGQADYVVHMHNDDCFDEEGGLICTLPEIEKHEHTEECYEEQNTLVCGYEEAVGHQHTAECYGMQQGELICVYPEHQHDDSCYDEEGVLICGMEEHQHTETCYGMEEVLNCQIPEGEGGHIHTEACYESYKVLACGKLELHTHTEVCYEKIDENAEYSEENRRLICEIPVLEEHIHTEEAGCIEIIEPNDEKKEEPEEQSAEVSEDQNQDQEPPETEKPDFTLTAEDEDYIITVTADKEAFPDVKGELSLKVERLGEDTEEYQTAQKLLSGQPKTSSPFDLVIEENGQEIPAELSEQTEEKGEEPAQGLEDGEENGEKHYVFDIVVLEDGNEIQPQIPVKVTFKLKSEKGNEVTGEIGGKDQENVSGKNSRVFHVDLETGVAEDMRATIDEDGNTVIDTPHFSVFDLIDLNNSNFSYLDTDKTWEKLAYAINGGDYNNRSIKLTLNADLEFTGRPIWLDNNRQLEIDLNGHSIFCGENTEKAADYQRAMFVMGNNSAGTLIIDDSSAVSRNCEKAFWGRPLDDNNEEISSIGMIKNDKNDELVLIKEKSSLGHVEIRGGYLKNTMNTVLTIEDGADVHFTKGYIYSKDTWKDFQWLLYGSWGWEGSVALAEDLEYTGVPIWVDNIRTLTLDLNGHSIKCKNGNTQKEPMFTVGNGGEYGHLIIKDSQYDAMSIEKKNLVDTESELGSMPAEPLPGVYDYETKKGEYHLTKSVPNDDGIHTSETTYRHTLDLSRIGAIENSEAYGPDVLIKVVGKGSVTINSGRFSNKYGSAIVAEPWIKKDENNQDVVVNGASVTLNGGYFVGNGQETARDEGGAICFKVIGDLTINDGVVIAANKAKRCGGGIRIKGSDNGLTNGGMANLNIEGGVICGNQATDTNGSDERRGGGGIFAQDTEVCLNDGYISNNQANNKDVYDCGGGLAVYWSFLRMQGGYITANKAMRGGGGLLITSDSKFEITGGTIASNWANAEGGGIRLNRVTGEIKAGENGQRIYITNNSTTSSVIDSDGVETRDWGGGGIFISDNSTVLRMEAALITENSAEGFGGGVGGCSTGRIFEEDGDPGVNVNRTAAIYDNNAKGSRLSGGYSSKHDDHDAHNNPNFMHNNGFQDVFSALGCYISSRMLGGGSANWTGSCDFELLEEDPGYIISTKMLGLTANPSNDDKENAVNNARVVLSGNSSGTHGGGIMCNGTLVLGHARELYFDDSLRVNLKKVYEDSVGEGIDLNKEQFTFVLLDKEKVGNNPDPEKLSIENGKVLYDKSTDAVVASSGNNTDAGNNVQLLMDYKYRDVFADGSEVTPRQYSYYLMEVDMKDPNIVYDPTVYRISLYLNKGSRSVSIGGEVLTIHYLYIGNETKDEENKEGQDYGITVEVLGEDGKWEDTGFSSEGDNDYGGLTNHKGTLINIDGDAFTNQAEVRPVTFSIYKTDNENTPLNYVPFTLYKLDENGKKGEGSAITYTNADGILSFTVLDQDGNYLLEEDVPADYVSAGPWFVEVKGEQGIEVYHARVEQDDVQNATYYKKSKKLEKVESGAFHIVNVKDFYKLPETGGIGNRDVYAVVLTLGIVSLLLGYIQIRRRKGEKCR